MHSTLKLHEIRQSQPAAYLPGHHFAGPLAALAAPHPASSKAWESKHATVKTFTHITTDFSAWIRIALCDPSPQGRGFCVFNLFGFMHKCSVRLEHAAPSVSAVMNRLKWVVPSRYILILRASWMPQVSWTCVSCVLTESLIAANCRMSVLQSIF